MQDLASNPNFHTIKLYRVCYRCKATGAIGKASSIDTLEDAEKRVNEFNARYGAEFVYFTEAVNVNNIEQGELLKLIDEGKLSLNQADLDQ